MNRITILLCGFLSLPGFNLQAQDWVGMMRNPNVNVHDIQKAFYKWHEKHHHESADKDTDEPANGEKEDDEAYGLFKRWEWYNVPRSDSNGNRADLNKVGSDYEKYLKNSSAHAAAAHGPRHSLTATTASWTYEGNTAVPTGNGGLGGNGRVNRVRTFPGNNSIMFACTASGGLWKTSDGGTSWSTTTDQLGTLTTSDVAINPLKPDIMYLATGDGDGLQSIYPTPNSVGVLKSYDGGSTWSATGLTSGISTQYFSVNELLIDPSDTSVLLAATSEGIYRSTNSGTTWTQTQTTGWFHSMEFHPGNPSIVYAGTSSLYSINGGTTGANFFLSTNNGVTWTQITSGLPSSSKAEAFEIAVTSADTADVYVLADSVDEYDYNGLYLSTNHGTSFSTQSASPTSPNILGRATDGDDYGVGQGWYDLALAVSQTNADSVWVGGINIWASANGGQTWTLNSDWTGTGAPFVHADIHDIQFLPGTNSQGYVVGCDGGVFTTSNSGTSWTNISSNLEIGQQYSIGLSASTAGLWISGWQDNGTNLSSSPWSLLFGGDGMDSFIDWSNNSNFYTTVDNDLYKSTNSGGAWTEIMSGITDNSSEEWVPKFLQDPKTSATLYSGFINVWKSTNSGGSWDTISNWGTATISALAVDSSNTSYIYAAQSNLIKFTTNGGASSPIWTNISSGLPVSSASISAIAVSAKSPAHVWVTFSGYSSGNKVFASTNSGSTWTNISSGLPNLPVNCIVSESGSPNGIYVGTDEGVYYHDTVINSWVFYNTGLPMVMIGDLKIYEPGQELVAATYGRGTWETPLYSSSSCTLSTTASTTANVSCNGGDNGDASASPSSGTTPYTYSWVNASSSVVSTSNPTGSVLTAGSYTVTVKDNNGCTATASADITQPAAALGITMLSHVNVLCNGNSTGSATANAATGGTSPYTYSWSPSGGTNLTASNLSNGTYTITAEDNHGCTATASADITQPAAALGITMLSHVNVLCNGNSTGSATANAATGGTSPYTYSWSPSGGTNLTASNLSNGTYTITAEDNHGCTATASADITQPAAALGITMLSHVNVFCNGNSTGSATANAATGGTSPYTYSWSPSGGTNLTASNLSTGTYTITAEDNHGCTATASADITQPAAALGITMLSHVNVLCNGNSTGSATANAATGGTSPYTYSWSPSGGTNLTASNLTAATYTITAEDNNGCTATTSTVITEPATMTVVRDSVDDNGNKTGIAAVTVSGGIKPYTYLWSPGNETTDTIKNQNAGKYCCVISDSNDCTNTTCITIKSSTGIEYISNSYSINIYPNPNTGQFAIAGVQKGMLIEIYDYTGRRISNIKSSNETIQFDLSAQANGIYFIRILLQDGTPVSEKKIVKTQ